MVGYDGWKREPRDEALGVNGFEGEKMFAVAVVGVDGGSDAPPVRIVGVIGECNR